MMSDIEKQSEVHLINSLIKVWDVFICCRYISDQGLGLFLYAVDTFLGICMRNVFSCLIQLQFNSIYILSKNILFLLYQLIT